MSASRHRFLSLLLVAFWFLATQHCVLEAAELFSDDHASASAGCCSKQAAGCEKDGCKAVEDGQYRAGAGAVKTGAPDALPQGSLLCAHLRLALAESDPRPTEKSRWHMAPDWVPAWQFERRAAAPAHAPDPLIA